MQCVAASSRWFATEPEKNGLAAPSKVQEQQQEQQQQATDEEWTEVVDEKSGQIYYWNQTTGELVDCVHTPAVLMKIDEWQ